MLLYYQKNHHETAQLQKSEHLSQSFFNEVIAFLMLLA